MLSVTSIQQEAANAQVARQSGNEGKARVCARRAAGWAIALWRRTQFESRCAEANAFQNLQWATQQNTLPPELRAAAQTLTVRILPDHTLPSAQDPLDAAQVILAFCLPQL